MGGRIGAGKEWQQEWFPDLLAASRKPFSIAGMKEEGMACPTMPFWNSNFTPASASSSLRGSMYLRREPQRTQILTP